jgi:hypothetical protein
VKILRIVLSASLLLAWALPLEASGEAHQSQRLELMDVFHDRPSPLAPLASLI